MKSSDTEQEEDFSRYSTTATISLFVLFFFMGVINHLGTILVMTGGRLLSADLGMKDYVSVYTSGATVFAIITRLVNSKFLLKVSYRKRMVFICFWMMAGYASMFTVLTLHEGLLKGKDVLCFCLSFIPCFFLGSSYAFGEGAIVAYLRVFPKTLLGGWSSGTGLSGLVSSSLNLGIQFVKGVSLKYLYLILIPLGPVYLILFSVSFKIYNNFKVVPLAVDISDSNKEKEKDNIDDIDKNAKLISSDTDSANNDNIDDSNNNANDNNKIDPTSSVVDMESHDSNIGQDSSDLTEDANESQENINKKNVTMSWENFKIVMNSVGRVIINLGIIYFSQFLCVNCVVVKVCAKANISFLPKGCKEIEGKQGEGYTFIKGQYEFINEFFQLGMFISKTFIKIVRKINPIEVYTISICVILVFYFFEYFFVNCHWGFYIPISLVLGFFSGGTYAGGFYTILNSEKVHKDFKELTVNVATLFNDIGTFLSGLVGLLFIKTILNDETKNRKYTPVPCEVEDYFL